MKQIYWCHVCDHKQVDLDKPETGTFYRVSGHTYQIGTVWHEQESPKDYTHVTFAICPDCNVLDALKIASR